MVSSTISILNDTTFSEQNSVKHALYQQFRIVDRDYAAFEDLLRYLQPTQDQLDDFQQSVVLCPPGFLDDDQLYGAFANTRERHSHYDSIKSGRPKDQQHSVPEAICRAAATHERTLCSSSWWARHPTLPWDEDSYHREHGQNIKDSQQPGCHHCVKSWADDHNSVCRRVACLCLSCNSYSGGTGRCHSISIHSSIRQNDLQISGTESEASPGVAGLSYGTTWFCVRRPVPGTKKVWPLNHAANASNSAETRDFLNFLSYYLLSY